MKRLRWFVGEPPRMGTPFIALLAKRLGGSAFGVPENVLAGIPQSADLLMFILARTLVGVGYGFCWMTLRNFALFASTGEEKALCFALLNAGIYAGMNCGAVMVRVMQRHYLIRRWSVFYNLLFAGGLILFGLWGGFIPAMAAMAVIGLADAFGFVAQNNYFLEFSVSRKLGHSRALSCISIIKKLAEMLGPIAFGFLFVMPGIVGVAVLGAVFLAAAVVYVILDRGKKDGHGRGSEA